MELLRRVTNTRVKPKVQHIAQAREATRRGRTVTYTAAADHESAQRSTSVLEVCLLGVELLYTPVTWREYMHS